MDSDEDDYLLRPTSKVILVPTSNLCSHECPKNRRGSPGRRSSPYRGDSSADGPRNYLVKGGNRAVEKANGDKLAKLGKSALRDLKVANSTLANELVRMQTCGHEAKSAYKEEINRLEEIIQLQQDKLSNAKAKLAREVQLRQEEEEKHTARLKEVARRLKEDQIQKLHQLQAEHTSMQRELAEKRREAAQAADLRERTAAAESRLAAEGSSRAELWHKCRTLEGQLQVANEKLASSGRALRMSEKQISACSDLEEELQQVREQLQSEKVAHTRLQAQCTIERGDAAADRAQLEYHIRELTALRARCDDVEAEADELRLDHREQAARAEHAVAELGHYKGRALRAEKDAAETREALEKQLVAVRHQALVREQRVAAELTAQAASLQSDLDTKCVEHSEAQAELAEARAQLSRLSSQVESLRHQGDAVGSQLASAKEKLLLVTQEKQELQEEVHLAEAGRLKGDAAMEELVASHKAKEEAWRKKAAGMSHSIEQWRSMATTKQKELELEAKNSSQAAQAASQEAARLNSEFSRLQEELRDAQAQLSVTQEGAAAAARRHAAALEAEQERSGLLASEVERLSAEVSTLDSKQKTEAHEAVSLRLQLRRLNSQLEACQLQLAEEQARVSALRDQLTELEAAGAADTGRYSQSIRELKAALQLEQSAKVDLQSELVKTAQRSKLTEAELLQNKAALGEAFDAKVKAEEAAAEAAAAMRATALKAAQYKKENQSLLSEYDTWITSLVGRKATGSMGGGTAPGNSSNVSSSNAEALAAAAKARATMSMAYTGGARSQSPSRVNSDFAALFGPGVEGPGSLSGTIDRAQQAADMERYDKIAALIEQRTSGRAALAKAGPASGRGSGLSPKPAFR